MDDNENKTLDFKEFKKGLHDYGIDLSGDEFFNVFKTFDRDDSGSIDFEEFLETLRVSHSILYEFLLSYNALHMLLNIIQIR